MVLIADSSLDPSQPKLVEWLDWSSSQREQHLWWYDAVQSQFLLNLIIVLNLIFALSLKLQLQLIFGLIECVSVKLKSDLPSIIYDDKLFSHTVDELFIFNKELENIEPSILELFPDCNLMNIFSNETLFSRILSLEKKSKYLVVISLTANFPICLVLPI